MKQKNVSFLDDEQNGNLEYELALEQLNNQDYLSAIENLKKAIQLQHLDAMFTLGKIYLVSFLF